MINIFLIIFYSLSILPFYEYKIADLVSLPLLTLFFSLNPQFFIKNKSYLIIGSIYIIYLFLLLFFSIFAGINIPLAIFHFAKNSTFMVIFLILNFIANKSKITTKSFLISLIFYFLILLIYNSYQIFTSGIRIHFPFTQVVDADPHLLGPLLTICLLFLIYNEKSINFHLKEKLSIFFYNLLKLFLFLFVFLSGSRGALLILGVNIIVYLFLKLMHFLKSLKINRSSLIKISFTFSFIGTFIIYFFEKFSNSIQRTFLINYLFSQEDPRSLSVFYSISKLQEYKLGLLFGNFFECKTFDFGLTYVICNIGIFGLILFLVFVLLISKDLFIYYKVNNFYIIALVFSVFLVNLFGSESYTIARYSYPLALMLTIQLKFLKDKDLYYLRN